MLMSGYFGGYAQYSDEFEAAEVAVARDIARAVVDTGRPLVAQTMYHGAPAAEAQREGGIPVYATIEAAAMATAAIVDHPPPPGAPSLPAQAPSDLDDGYFGSRDLLAAAGVPFVDARRAVGVEAAVAAGVELGFPVVLKALGTLHKSDAGGVGSASPTAGSWRRPPATCTNGWRRPSSRSSGWRRSATASS